MFHIMADEPIPSVKVAVQEEMYSLASRTTGLYYEEELSVDFGSARGRLASKIVCLPWIEQVEQCRAARAPHNRVERTFINREFLGYNAVSKVRWYRHHLSNFRRAKSVSNRMFHRRHDSLATARELHNMNRTLVLRGKRSHALLQSLCQRRFCVTL